LDFEFDDLDLELDLELDDFELDDFAFVLREELRPLLLDLDLRWVATSPPSGSGYRVQLAQGTVRR
jgi:hypothetical protein